MRIVAEAGNQMPVQMRHHIAEAGQVDFLGLHHFTQRGFDLTHGAHQGRPVFYRQIGHFLDVCIPDHAAEARVIGICNQYDAQLLIAEQDFAAGFFAQLAGRRHA